MNLKERFETKSSIDTTKEAKVFAGECEKIAEDFAIGFAKWFALNHTEEVFYEDNYTKEMLEKYKKEKGL